MRTDSYKMACVFGGTGFIGRQIVRGLAREGYTVKVATRVPERAYFLRTAGNVGQIVPFACNYADDASLRAAVKGCALVINCVGILFEKGRNTFLKTHAELPRRIAKACAAEKVERFVHISALGCEASSSKYGKSKYQGEQAILENFKDATILRPSVVFGVEDNFFNMFAKMATVLPVLPLIGGGHTKFQPVYVGDVAEAVIVAGRTGETKGQTYELGGPDIFTFRQIYEKLFKAINRKPILVSLPWGVAKFKGCLLQILPKPPLTSDQVESLKSDNVVAPNARTLKDLGITPTSADTILPTYLARYRPGGRFGDKKRA